MINTITHSSDILSMLCVAQNKWGMFLSFKHENDGDEILKAAPYLSHDRFLHIWLSFGGYIFADTKEEIEDLYLQTVGDDGPTDRNPYRGPASVYALTCAPTGVLITENT